MKRLILPIAVAAFALAAAGIASAQTKDETKADPKADPKAGVQATAEKTMACCMDKSGADKKECADKDCCKMDKAHGEMHGKMDDKEMKTMMEKHGTMDSKEMKAMHEKMMKKMKDKDGDDDKAGKEDTDKDDDLL